MTASTLPDPEPRDDPALDRWITTGDLDELLREVDRRADRGDWDGVVIVANRARATTGSVAMTRSIRMPRCWWKSPAR